MHVLACVASYIWGGSHRTINVPVQLATAKCTPTNTQGPPIPPFSVRDDESAQAQERLSMSIRYPAPRQVIGRQLDHDTVAPRDTDVIHPHLA